MNVLNTIGDCVSENNTKHTIDDENKIINIIFKF